MENLRLTVERDLEETLEGEFSVDVKLINPDGHEQIYKKNSTRRLCGQVLNFSRVGNPETGENIVITQLVVSLRISSLDRVPVSGERWIIEMAVSPTTDAPVYKFEFSTDRSAEHGSDIGFMRIYPTQIIQEQDEVSS